LIEIIFFEAKKTVTSYSDPGPGIAQTNKYSPLHLIALVEYQWGLGHRLVFKDPRDDATGYLSRS
jgi:hypothetical protein